MQGKGPDGREAIDSQASLKSMVLIAKASRLRARPGDGRLMIVAELAAHGAVL
jgi:hypothetical protein